MSHNFLTHKMIASLSIAAIIISLLAMVVSYKYRHSVNLNDLKIETVPPSAADVERALKQRPEMIIEVFDLLREKKVAKDAEDVKNQKENVKKSEKELFHHEMDPVGGNPNGDVTVAEFFDYRCGFCRRAFGSVKDALSSDGKVKIVYKELPIMGDHSLARATLAAHKQGKYYAFHQALMNSKGSLDAQELEALAKKLKLDIGKWKTDMESDDVKNQIQENLKLADKLAIRATPTFVVGEVVIPGAVDAEHLKRTFSEERKKAKA